MGTRTAPSAPSLLNPLYLEWLVGLALVAALGWGTLEGWQFYDTVLRPKARPVPVMPKPPAVRADDPEAVRRYQEILDNLGAATTSIAARRPDWAYDHLQRVLQLDPDNADARALLNRLEHDPALQLTPEEEAQRARERHIADLLGAASSSLIAGHDDAARAYATEALALDPANAPAQQLLARLDAAR